MLPKMDGPLHPDGSFSQANPRNRRVVPSKDRTPVTGAWDQRPRSIPWLGLLGRQLAESLAKPIFVCNRATTPSPTALDWHHKRIDAE
jgi:hypothetical protein